MKESSNSVVIFFMKLPPNCIFKVLSGQESRNSQSGWIKTIQRTFPAFVLCWLRLQLHKGGEFQPDSIFWWKIFKTLRYISPNLSSQHSIFIPVCPFLCPSIHPFPIGSIHPAQPPNHLSVRCSLFYKAGNWGQKRWNEQCLVSSELAITIGYH